MSEDMNKDIELFDQEEDENEGEFTVSDNFGIMLKHYRTKVKNYSLKQLEELSGVSASYANRLETGERRSPSITIVLQLAEALGIPNSVLAATIIKKQQGTEQILLSDLLIKHDYLLNGKKLTRAEKEYLMQIIEHIAKCTWNQNSKVRELFELAELVDKFKQAM